MLIAEILRDEVFSHAVDLRKIENGILQGPIRRLLRQVQNEVLRKLQDPDLTDFQNMRLIAQRNFLEDTIIGNYYEEGRERLRSSLIDLSRSHFNLPSLNLHQQLVPHRFKLH